MLTLLVAAVLNGEPTMLTTGPAVEAQLKAGPVQVAVSGTVERVSLGRKGGLGTAVVLDDGTVDRAELTLMIDVATRSIPAAVLRPTTKAVAA